jgi:hypothetical protein
MACPGVGMGSAAPRVALPALNDAGEVPITGAPEELMQ